MFPLKLAFRARILLDDKASASINPIICTSRTHHRLSVWIKLQCGSIKQFTCLVGIKEVRGRPFWAKPVLRRFSGQFVRRSKLFCRWFLLLGQAVVHICCCLNPLEVTFLLFGFVWWLDCLLLKEGPSTFCSVRWLLEVFLVVAEFAGFRAGGRLPFGWLYWIIYCPLWAPLAPSRFLPRFSARTEDEVIS